MRAVSEPQVREKCRGSRLGLRASAALLSLLLAGAAAGQNGSEKPAAAEVSRPKPIPVGEVLLRAQEGRTLLAEIERRALPDPAVDTLAGELLARAAEVEELASEHDARLAEQPSAMALAASEREWTRQAQYLQHVSRVISRRTSVLTRDIERLSELRGVWKATHDEAVAREITGVLLERIEAAFAAIGETRGVVEKRLALLVQIQDEVRRQQAIVSGIQSQIGDARQQQSEEIFAFGRPPLWAAERSLQPRHWDTVREQLREELARISDFERDRRGRLISFLLFSLALTGLIRALKEPARSWAREDESFATAAGILERPVAAGVLVCLLFAALFVFPTAPSLVVATSGLVLIVPILRLLPHSILPGVAWALYAVTGWYALDFVFRFLVVDPLLARLALLAQSGGVLLLLLWLLRPARLAGLRSASRALRAVGFGLRLCVPVLAVAVLSNVLGNVSLADVLTRGMRVGLYLALLLFAAARVLEMAYAVTLRTQTARSLRMVRLHTPLLLARGNRLIRFVGVVMWLDLTTEVFLVHEILVDDFWAVLTATARVGDLEFSLGDIVLFGLMIWLSLWISRFVRFVLEEDVLSRTQLPRGVPFAVSTIVRYAILLVGFMLATAAAGIDMSRFALLVGALGVGIGIGLQDVVNNFVSGLILLFERPIQIGDIVEVGTLSGEVRRIGLRASTVRTFDGSEVVIPNSQFVSSQFVNWTLSDKQRRISIAVGVAYGSDPQEVLRVLLEVARADSELLAEPEPAALFVGFGESSLDFELRVWTRHYDGWLNIRTRLGIAIEAALRTAGLVIPFPQRDLHLHSVAAGIAPPAAGDDPA